MSIDARSVVSAIEAASAPVRLSELDACVFAATRERDGGSSPAEVTEGLATAIRNGWVHTDGLRVFVSGSGRNVAGH